jgi:hypothetical protein
MTLWVNCVVAQWRSVVRSSLYCGYVEASLHLSQRATN